MPRRLVIAAVLGVLLVGGTAFIVEGREGGAAMDDGVVNDRFKAYAGDWEYAEPLANDVLPGEGVLVVCDARADERDLRLEIVTGAGGDAETRIRVKPRAAVPPGPYQIEYTACRGERQGHATVTLTVLARPDVTVEPVPGSPGKFLVRNGSEHTMWFRWRHVSDEAPYDGRFELRAGEKRTVQFRRHEIVWEAHRWNKPRFYLSAKIEDIELAPGTRPLGPFPGWTT